MTPIPHLRKSGFVRRVRVKIPPINALVVAFLTIGEDDLGDYAVSKHDECEYTEEF
jgi:hypothetical protein